MSARIIKKLRERLCLTVEQASDDEILEATKGTLLLACVELEIAVEYLIKAVSLETNLLIKSKK